MEKNITTFKYVIKIALGPNELSIPRVVQANTG